MLLNYIYLLFVIFDITICRYFCSLIYVILLNIGIPTMLALFGLCKMIFVSRSSAGLRKHYVRAGFRKCFPCMKCKERRSISYFHRSRKFKTRSEFIMEKFQFLILRKSGEFCEKQKIELLLSK